MSESLVPDFDPKRLERQQSFLLDRAKAHDEAEGANRTWHSACAASLIRDAAAIALLRGSAEQAIPLFHRAGERFVRLGVFTGFSLLEFSKLGEARRWLVQSEGMDGRIERALPSDEGVFEGRDDINAREPFLTPSASSPRQLLDLYRSLSAQQEGGHDLSLRERVRSLLWSFPQLPIGPTGGPLGGYLKMLDQVTSVEHGTLPQLTSSINDAFLSLILRRSEQLDSAQKDHWHWKLLLNPADLIDFDLLALGTIIIDRTGTTFPFDEIAESRGGLTAIPFRAAQLLRSELRPRPSRWRG